MNNMMQDYEKLVKTEYRTNEETSKLKNIALELFQLGYINDKRKIDSIN